MIQNSNWNQCDSVLSIHKCLEKIGNHQRILIEKYVFRFFIVILQSNAIMVIRLCAPDYGCYIIVLLSCIYYKCYKTRQPEL